MATVTELVTGIEVVGKLVATGTFNLKFTNIETIVCTKPCSYITFSIQLTTDKANPF